MTLPFALTGVAADINRNPGAARVGFVPTAADNMSPGNPFIMGLLAIPFIPSVKVNSIIAVEGDGEAAYVRDHNKEPRPLIWTASASSTLRKIKRCKEALETGH